MADLESDWGNPRKNLKMADQGSGVGIPKKSNNMANQGFCGVKPAETMADEDCLTMTTIAKELLRKNQSIKDFAVPVCLDELRRKDGRTKINKDLLENWIENGIKEGLKYYQSIFSGIVIQVCQIIQVRKIYKFTLERCLTSYNYGLTLRYFFPLIIQTVSSKRKIITALSICQCCIIGNLCIYSLSLK